MTPEQTFNKQVENAPIVKEIIGDLNGLKIGQKNLEDKVEKLEKKVDDGFREIKNDNAKLLEAVTSLRDEVKSDKEKALLDSNQELKEELKRKRTNGDKIKNGSIVGFITVIGGYILENLGIINVIGQ